MAMRALVIDDAAEAEIDRVKRYAESHIVSRRDVLATMENACVPVGDNPDHVCVIHDGYRVVFSIEDQPAGMVRHLSVSVDAEGMCPSLGAMRLIAEKFGFGEIECCRVWLEEDGRAAVNVAEVMI